MRAVLVDAGPLIALLDRSDPDHQKCREALKEVKDPLFTVWPALTEAMYLLHFSWKAQSALWEMVETEILKLFLLDHQDAARMKELMRKYQDLPMDLADAALVRVAERENVRKVFTLDRRDFQLYRPMERWKFSIIP